MNDGQNQWRILHQKYLDAAARLEKNMDDSEADNERDFLFWELHSLPAPDLKSAHEKLMLVIDEQKWCPRGHEYDDDKNILTPIADIISSSQRNDYKGSGKTAIDFAIRLLEGIAREENMTPDGPQGFVENSALAPVLNDLRRLAPM